MGKVDEGRLGTQRPKIEPDDLEEDVFVGTIAAYEELEVEDPEAEGGKRASALLQFEETGDKVCWLNTTGLKAVIAAYGDESDNWIGQPCPIERVRGTAFGKTYYKVSVCPKDVWPEYVDFDTPKPRRPASRKKTKKTKRARK